MAVAGKFAPSPKMLANLEEVAKRASAEAMASKQLAIE